MKKFIILIILFLLVIPSGAEDNEGKDGINDVNDDKHLVETKPVSIEIPINDKELRVDNVDISISKQIETNFNMCLENKYFNITLTNEIDTISLGQRHVDTNICEVSTFACEGTNTLHQTGVRITVCPSK